MTLIENALLKIEEKEARRNLLAEKRKGYLKELWYEFHPLPKGMIKYLNNHTATELLDLAMECIFIKATKQYERTEIIGGNIPADWIKIDPILKYVLTHNIPDRLKRNAILFKNFAIGFIYSGLSDVEIREYAQKIIINCPGKNISEILGWVQKIRRDVENGKDWEYNRGEMNKWIEEANKIEG